MHQLFLETIGEELAPAIRLNGLQAVIWDYARARDRLGIEIHPYTEVTGVRVFGRQAESVTTNRGEIAAGTLVNATAGWASMVAEPAGITLPIVSHPLQACVTEPLKPFLSDVGWGTYGFKAAPAAAKNLAELLAKIIEPFSSARFYGGQLVGEKTAVAVSS